jgi:hypothetical protein
MQNLVLPLVEMSGDPVLAGRDEGAAMASKILQKTGQRDAAVLVTFDFSGITLATASYLDEVTLRLRPALRERFAYPLPVNMVSRVLEEFESLLERANDAFLIGSRGSDGAITDLRVVGKLDSKLRETYDLVRAKTLASAVELFNTYSGAEKIGATAWNNRLNALAEKGLLQEIPAGREKKFRPLAETF